MTAAIVTQDVVESTSDANSNARVTQSVIESSSSIIPQARASHIAMEVMSSSASVTTYSPVIFIT